MEYQNEQNSQRRTMKMGGISPRQGSLRGGLQHMTRLALVIILDATQSMTPYIEAVLKALQHMLDILMHAEFEPLVGMVIFRDELEGEMPEVYEVGTPPAELKAVLSRLKAIGGGTIPESSLPAIMNAVSLVRQVGQDMTRVFLHITDAPPHDPEAGHTARSVLEALKQEHVLFFACAPDEEPYRSFANVTGGTLFPLEKNLDAETFQGVLTDFARTTVKTIKMGESGISNEVRDLLRSAQGNR